MNRLIGGVLVFSGLIALKSAFSEVTPVDKPFDSEFKSFNAEFESYLLKAEVIGEGLGEGSFGRVFTLPDGNVLKIVNLDDQSRAIRKQNRAQANFVRDYLIKTRSGEWKESPFLPKIYHYNEGTASPKMISLMEQEGVSRRNPLSNQQVAFWVMEKIPYVAEDDDWMNKSMGVLEDKKDWRKQLKEGLRVWLDKQNMKGLHPDDIHEGNYGFRETSKGATPVYFDMSFAGNESLPYSA